MSILSPTNLETNDYGEQGWNAVFNADVQRLNDYLAKFQPAWDVSALADNVVLQFNSTSGKWEAVEGYSGDVVISGTTLTFVGGVLTAVS